MTYYRRNPLIRIASPVASIPIFGGALITSIGALFELTRPTSSRCTATFVVLPLGFVIVYATIFMRSLRLWKIFYNPRLRHNVLETNWMLKRASLFTLLLVSIVLAAELSDPPNVESGRISFTSIAEFCSGGRIALPIILATKVALCKMWLTPTDGNLILHCRHGVRHKKFPSELWGVP